MTETTLATSIGEHSNDETIANITLAHISDRPPYYSPIGEGGYISVMERRYDRAQNEFAKVGFEPAHRDSWDNRVYDLDLHNDTNSRSPSFRFLVTNSLLAKIKTAQEEKGEDLSQDELLVIGLSEGEDAVDPDFSTSALNAINASYYASQIAFDPSARLATMFAQNRPLNVALGALIARSVDSSGSDKVRIKEISSGNNTEHWMHIVSGLINNGASDVEVTLTDFVEPVVDPNLDNSQMKVNTEAYSLFDDMPVLSETECYDTLITTYGFDSVWQPEDLSFRRLGDKWYKRMYRVKVADWAPRREELLLAMREGRPLIGGSASDYDGIVVETAMEPVDISNHPFARYIHESGRSSLNFPGGLIKRVINAFDSQLNQGGIFVIGDVGNFGFQDAKIGAGSDVATSGVAARYRMDDFILAKRVLEAEYGLEVSLIGLSELANKYLPGGWSDNSTTLEQEQIARLPSNGIMLVRRSQKLDMQGDNPE